MPSCLSPCLSGCMRDRAAVTHHHASLSHLCLTTPPALPHVAVYACCKRRPSRATTAHSARVFASLSSLVAPLPCSQGLASRSRYERKRLSILSQAAVMGRKVEVSVLTSGQRRVWAVRAVPCYDGSPIPRSFVDLLETCSG